MPPPPLQGLASPSYLQTEKTQACDFNPTNNDSPLKAQIKTQQAVTPVSAPLGSSQTNS